MRRFLSEWLALVVVLLNAIKAPVVDDTAYLFHARHLSQNPTHPYSFELFWYSAPEPAMGVLLPPVLPYWLALGISLFGENLFLLKLTLLPFLWLFTRSIHSLLKTIAPGWENYGLVVMVCSPVVLPMINFMLDIPAISLGLGSVALLMARPRLGVVVGVLGALAIQTKYTMLVLPGVWVAWGITAREWRGPLMALLAAAVLLVGWETFVWHQEGASHFLIQVSAHSHLGEANLTTWQKLQDFIGDKGALGNPAIALLGGLGVGWGLLAGWSLNWPRMLLLGTALVIVVGYGLIVCLPASSLVLLSHPDTGVALCTFPQFLFLTLGGCTIGTVLLAIFKLIKDETWDEPYTVFLVIWLLGELATYFILTPFPAGRRIISLTLVIGLLVLRAMSQNTTARFSLVRWLAVFCVGHGILIAALDLWDAEAERDLGHKTIAEVVKLKKPSDAIYTQGHWGWQYIMDRGGVSLIEPGRTLLKPGDWLIHPVQPGHVDFYRPYHGQADYRLPDHLEFHGEWVWEDMISATTVPNLYGGKIPFQGRDHPRLRVRIYRVNEFWIPQRK
ncbi:MAG: hypothetical protein ACRC8S_09120 [Fimbriiglobus sp.]